MFDEILAMPLEDIISMLGTAFSGLLLLLGGAVITYAKKKLEEFKNQNTTGNEILEKALDDKLTKAIAKLDEVQAKNDVANQKVMNSFVTLLAKTPLEVADLKKLIIDLPLESLDPQIEETLIEKIDELKAIEEVNKINAEESKQKALEELEALKSEVL